MGKKKRRELRQQALMAEETKSLPEINPDATLTPEVSFNSGTSGAWKREDITNVPSIGERDEDADGHYASTPSEFIDKYIGKFIPGDKLFSFLMAFLFLIIAGWIFIQDNGAGLLKDWSSIGWTIQKILITLIFLFILFAGLYFAFGSLSKINKKQKNENSYLYSR